MAHNYPEVVGEVDVISDAEHIKKLLKIPFNSDAELSMVVHRIGRTLLFSDFDIPKLLAHFSAKGYENLDWLRDFYFQTSGGSLQRHFASEECNREQAVLQSLLSKHVEYSAAATSMPDPNDLNLDVLSLQNVQPQNLLEEVFMSKVLSQSETMGRSSTHSRPEHSFQRDILWNFEDLTMLVGSDLPIFGGGKYPVVSLRLRDASTPINILTGLDYWLDNLMCNVPEVVMCFHVKGIVKKYEIVKTEDLPNLEGGTFSPKVIKDIAQNVLSFLKANCTKEGHTYWLFKGEKDDVVKLYDLTTICNERSSDVNQNPYTIAVGTLFYKVARNMINSGQASRSNFSTIKTLLCNCLVLLDSSSHPELTHAVNALLADLFLTELNETAQDEEQSHLKIEEVEQDEDGDITTQSDDDNEYVQHDADQCTGKLADSMEILSKEAQYRKVIYYVVQAMRCYLDANLQSEGSTVQKEITDATNEVTRFHRDISNLQHRDMEEVSLEQELCVVSAKEFKQELDTRHTLWELTDNHLYPLFRKLVQAYCKLAEVCIRMGKYGRALKFLRIGLACYAKKPIRSESVVQISLHAKLLMMIGDVMLFLTRCNDESRLAHKEEFSTLNTDDQYVLDVSINKAIGEDEFKVKEPFNLHEENLLQLASSFYKKSLDLYPEEAADEVVSEVVDVTSRLGNVRNELGVYYMDCAANSTRGFGNPQEAEQELWKTSYTYLEQGIKAFQAVDDKQNVALLYSNAGRLMRLCAHVAGNSTKESVDTERGPFTQEEKTYYNKAFEFYQRAFSSLGVRSANSEIWDKVTDEISGAYFAMACVLQDHAPYGNMPEDQVMKEVLSLMMKSLHYCEELSTQGRDVSLNVVKRTGNIHHRIASLYHHWIRHQSMDAVNKKYRTLAEKHYDKACSILKPEYFPCDYLRSVVESNGLRLRSIHQTQNIPLQAKSLLNVLDFTLSEGVQSSLRSIARDLKVRHDLRDEDTGTSPTTSMDPKPSINVNIQECVSILGVVDVQLCDSLREILRVCKLKQSGKSSLAQVLSVATAKKMYETALRNKSRLSADTDDKEIILNTCNQIIQVIEQLFRLRNSNQNVQDN